MKHFDLLIDRKVKKMANLIEIDKDVKGKGER